MARFGNGIGAQNAGWLYEGERVIAELDHYGWVIKAFAYATKRNVPDLMLKWNGSGFDLYRIVSDQLGSPIVVIKVDGNVPNTSSPVLESFAWDELGNPKGAWPAQQPFGFAGGLWDADAAGHGTWMYHFGARDYSTRATWWSKDPARFGGGMNFYLYANGDPVNFIDPRGRMASPVGIGIGAGLAVGGVATWGALGEAGLSLAPLAPYALPVLAGAVVIGAAYWAYSSSGASSCASWTPAWPGHDPTVSPGSDFGWRGNGPPSSGKGSWYNPNTGETLHPDLSHAPPDRSTLGLH